MMTPAEKAHVKATTTYFETDWANPDATLEGGKPDPLSRNLAAERALADIVCWLVCWLEVDHDLWVGEESEG